MSVLRVRRAVNSGKPVGAAAAIAERALQQVDTPYRLFGRTPGRALDCVGLVLAALAPHFPDVMPDLQYGLKGDHLAKARACFAATGFYEIDDPAALVSGDILLVAPAPLQLHFMVCVPGGWVHADAGLGRVVLRPGALPWPVRCGWRLREN